MKRIALAVIAVALTGCMMFKRPPVEPKAYERTQASAAHLYRATFTPAESIRVGRLHTWKLDVVSANGAPVDNAKITVDGGMPQHGHGLPTKPIVTLQADGTYGAEGMKFNMGGWWVVRIHIDGAQGSDVVTFNLKL
jgi:hypothetical protein